MLQGEGREVLRGFLEFSFIYLNVVLFCIKFDSCVKSWEYFRTRNISLESTFHWLSKKVLKLEADVGVYE